MDPPPATDLALHSRAARKCSIHGWHGSLAAGSVDVITSGDFGQVCSGLPSSRCVDLDGPPAGRLESLQTFAPGHYLLQLDLIGNRYRNDVNAALIAIGGFSQTITMTGSEGPTTFTFNVVLTADSRLTIASASPEDSYGLYLDNVAVTQIDQVEEVPEPASVLLLGTGLGGIVVKVCRRSKANKGAE